MRGSVHPFALFVAVMVVAAGVGLSRGGDGATSRAAAGPGEQYRAGDKVRHGTFGEGVVGSSSGVGSDTQVAVAFAGQGVKRLMLSFAPLEKVVAEESPTQFDPDEDEIEIQDPDLFAP